VACQTRKLAVLGFLAVLYPHPTISLFGALIMEISTGHINCSWIGTTLWLLEDRRFRGGTLGAIQLCGGIFLSVGVVSLAFDRRRVVRQNPLAVRLRLGQACLSFIHVGWLDLAADSLGCNRLAVCRTL